ncbi:MAG: DNA polymerase III subunit gamma/tau [Pseudomonadales bacterium]
MSYQVLARKWRPKTFEELAGQEHVLKALVNALENQRLHHAYLFTGTRGVGKTTIARILARSLNCEKGITSQPCGECSACQEINEGRFVDLIEVDAASRTKVEDTRELLENIQYRPTRGRYKIYLIDEVHMLSAHSFNALLKTLEEPPEHVKFLLATTDPQKLPVTVLSRCLQFNLKNLTAARIEEHLAYILGEEKVPTETEALWHIARAANGSMRDALSLTDQAISHGGGKLSEAEVVTMLGTVDRRKIYQLVDALAAGNTEELLAISDSLAEFSPDYFALVQDILVLMHAVAVQQSVPTANRSEGLDKEKIETYARIFSPEDVQIIYQMLLMGQKDIAIAPDLHMGFEMLLLRLAAFQPLNPSEQLQSDKASVGSKEESASLKKPEPEPQRAAQPAFSEPVNALEPADTGREQLPEQESTQAASEKVSRAQPPAPVSAAGEFPEERFDDDDDSEDFLLETEQFLAENLTDQLPEAPEAIAEQSSDNQEETIDDDLVVPENLSELGPESWIALFGRLQVGGMLKSLCAHLVLESVQANDLQFILTPDGQAMFNDAHKQKLAEAISAYFNAPVAVSVRNGDTDRETPSMYAKRRYQEKLLEAEQSIMNSPVVQKLVDEFQAELVPGSVKLNRNTNKSHTA